MFVLHFELFIVMEKYILCGTLWTIVGRVIPRLHPFDSNSNFIFFSLLDYRCTPSPSAEKKRRQQLSKSDEQAALAREKHRLAMRNHRQGETDEQAALARGKKETLYE